MFFNILHNKLPTKCFTTFYYQISGIHMDLSVLVHQIIEYWKLRQEKKCLRNNYFNQRMNLFYSIQQNNGFLMH